VAAGPSPIPEDGRAPWSFLIRIIRIIRGRF